MVKKDKGKGRASEPEPTETSPLLGSGSPSRSHSDSHVRRPHPHPHLVAIDQVRIRESRTRSILYIALIVALSLFLGCGLFLVLLLNSFRPTPAELDSLQDTAFRYSGPDGISVVNITEAGILVNVSLKAGIDWDKALGIQQWANEEEKQGAVWKGERGTGAEWWENLRRWTASKMMGQLSERSIKVEIPDQVIILPDHFNSFPLLSVSIPSAFRVPLVMDAPINKNDSKWLPPLHILALAKPVASTGDLLAFAQRAWEQGEVKVVIGVPKARATIPITGWLAKFARIEKEDITKSIQMPVPELPGLPPPGDGKPLNLSSLVHLDSYTLSTRNDQLHIAALATIPNIAPELNTTLPFNLPFSIHLPDGQRMADVVTSPLRLGGPQSHINVYITGVVVADFTPNEGEDSRNSSDSAVSLFLQNYLNGRDNPIAIRGLSTLPSFAQSHPWPPHWLLTSLPSLSIPLAFPGPSPKPKIIQTVTIERMRISEAGGKMLASGTVIAEISLPKGMEAVDVAINFAKPDIYVSDGPPEDDDDDSDPNGEDDYPSNAFGHIRPDEWLKATSERYSNPEHPDWITVQAPMEDIPIEILKGRDGIMRGFVRKIVFKGGALAGIKGSADVQVQLKGVRGEVGLEGLPVKGEVWVGRQRAKLPWVAEEAAEGEVGESEK